MSTRSLKAKQYFQDGYNCSQAVLLSFGDMINIDKNTLAMLSSSFGGGMGRLREVCGTVSGMFMVAGILYGYSSPTASEEKKAHYIRIQELAENFKKNNPSIVCRELLGLSQKGADDPTPAIRTSEYYQKRPCADLVEEAVEIMENYIAEHPIETKE